MNTKVFWGVSPKGMLSSILNHKLLQNPDGMHLLHRAVKQTDSLLLLPRVWIGKINILCNCLDHLCLPLMCLSDPKAIFWIGIAANTACYNVAEIIYLILKSGMFNIWNFKNIQNFIWYWRVGCWILRRDNGLPASSRLSPPRVSWEKNYFISCSVTVSFLNENSPSIKRISVDVFPYLAIWYCLSFSILMEPLAPSSALGLSRPLKIITMLWWPGRLGNWIRSEITTLVNWNNWNDDAER